MARRRGVECSRKFPRAKNPLPPPELPIPAETDPYANRITLCLLTEPCNLKIVKRFLATEIRIKTDQVQEVRDAVVSERPCGY